MQSCSSNVIDTQTRINSLPITGWGKLFYAIFPYRRKLIFSNMRRVFGSSLNQQQFKLLAQAYYSHLATSLWEMIAMRFMSNAELANCVEVRGHEIVLKAAEAGKGIAVLTGHFGNWEYAPIAGALQFPQFKNRFHMIRKKLGIKWIEQRLFRQSYEAGITVIENRQAMQAVSEALGRNDLVVFVMDQFASVSRKRGIPVEFFGEKVGTYRSLATIVSHHGTPVIPAITYRKSDGSHVLEYFEPLLWIEDPDRKTAIALNTRQYNKVLEDFVLQVPEQWLWLHRRWKRDESPPSRG